MYLPKFTITNRILKHIGAIEASREMVVNAPIVPAWEKKFVEEATLRTVHYGTAIEGNALSFDQAREVLEGKEVMARQRDIQEVLNYRNVMTYLDRLEELYPGKEHELPFEYTDELVCRIQALAVEKLIDHGIGEYRKTQVIIRSVRTGEASFKAPSAVEVPYLMESFLRWLNSQEGKEVHPVLRAGITHYVLAAIHPFVDGNGRTSRALAMLVLFMEGYDIRRLFSLEEHFDKDIMHYYEELQKISNQSPMLEERDLTSWLEYFTEVLAIELTQVKDQIRKLSMDDKLKNKVGKQIALSERQVRLVEFLKEHESLSMRDAKDIISGVSEDTILRDLKELMKKKLVKKVGKTKAAKYVLS